MCATTIVQDAWKRGQKLRVHSWIYGLQNGLLKDLGLSVGNFNELAPTYEAVVQGYHK